MCDVEKQIKRDNEFLWDSFCYFAVSWFIGMLGTLLGCILTQMALKVTN